MPTLPFASSLPAAFPFVAALVLAVRAPQSPPVEPWVGQRGITETVETIMERDRLAGPPDLSAGPKDAGPELEVEREGLRQDPRSPRAPMWPPPVAPGIDPVLPCGTGMGGTFLPQTVGTSFLAVNVNESGFIPPDTVGAVGPTQVLVVANGRIKVFSKSGILGGLNASTNSFFTSVRNGSGTSDPQVKYDRLSGRWIVTMINVQTPNRVLIAVSSGSTITSSSSFTFYFFQQDTVNPPGNTGQLADYPKVGVDANAIVIGCNMFTSSYQGTTAWVVRKSSVLSGGPIVVTALRGLATASGPGPSSPSGIDNDDPAATESFLIGVSNDTFGRLVLRRISNPGGSPTVGGNLNVTVPTTTVPIQQVALGSAATLDALDDRLFNCQMHRDRVTGTTSVWTSHNIQVNSSGTASNSGGRNGSRWYQIGNLSGTPALIQSGTLFDPAGAGPRGYWMPSVAMSGTGPRGARHELRGTRRSRRRRDLGPSRGRSARDRAVADARRRQLVELQHPGRFAAALGRLLGDHGRSDGRPDAVGLRRVLQRDRLLGRARDPAPRAAAGDAGEREPFEPLARADGRERRRDGHFLGRLGLLRH
jgi:hypothetical protein